MRIIRENKFMVGVVGDEIVILKPIAREPMSHDDAINLVQHILALLPDEKREAVARWLT